MSLRKDRVRLISFAAKMDGVSEEEFRRVMTERYKVFCSLPVAQKYILKDELSFRNDNLGDPTQILGLKPSRVSVLRITDFESKEHIQEACAFLFTSLLLSDPQVGKMLDAIYVDLVDRDTVAIFPVEFMAGIDSEK
ncbi:hypothetical protein C8J57DRAFT_1490117 [Mycena rebaudengoi]|nr:hypothetical protein C8J57DRAFT_1490117 [Mycena rebaudengoi]